MNTLRIAWIAVRELFYEKAFYILLCFSLASLVFSLLLSQLTYAEQAKLTLDFMLGFTHLSMVLFSVFMGIPLFQKELQTGSVAMVLSKPISRTSFLLGKYLGQVGVQTLLTFAMGLLTLLACGRFEAGISSVATLQTTLLIACEASVLTAITYVFAVNTGAITTALLTLALFALGHTRESINSTLKQGEDSALWKIVATFIPDLEIFNMKQLASYGQALPWTDVGWALLYGAVCLFFYLVVATFCFHRKDILT
jgi:ABC-type transport system involved in multi-copper enzyme maturation permease subunit